MDLLCDPSIDNPNPPPDLSAMSGEPPSSPIHSSGDHKHHSQNNNHNNNDNRKTQNNNNNNIVRRERPSRACTARSAARLYAAAAEEAEVVASRRRPKSGKRDRRREEEVRSPSRSPSPPPNQQQWSKVVTQLVSTPPPSQLPRWSLRSMWELASILNFLNVFRALLNIKVEFTVEEFETALLTPNNTLGDIHIPLLKAIPPITRMALGRNTWVTVLCRKLRDWWHWVAEGDLPIVASHGAEIEAYNALDPGIRVVILKALCDIRVEQEDIRNYIDDSIKHGVQLSAFRKERIGGDSHGISYWYEDDPIIGHRLYREIRKVEVKKGKGKSVQPIPSSSYQWETVATNFEEFQDVSEKLFSSLNRTEASLGKKLKIDKLPDIEKEYKRRERLLKKQHRQALLLDNMIGMDELAPGRSLRDRKPVTYTFDDYDKSINDAIKITKSKQPSPEPTGRREFVVKPEASTNGRWSGGPSQIPQRVSFEIPSPKSPDFDETDEDHKSEPLDRSDRRRQKPQRYSANKFVKAVSDNETDLDSDDDIVGEAVYDEEYLRKRKERRKASSSSEGDEEYNWDQENAEEEDYEEEEEDDDSASVSDDSDEPKKVKKMPGRTRRETKLRSRSVNELQSGLRRSERATRNRIDYRKYEFSESDTESMKPEKSNGSDENSGASNNAEFSMVSEDSELEANDDGQEMKIDQPIEEQPATVEKEQKQNHSPEKSNTPSQDEVEGVRKRRFLDLNELAPGSGFEDGPTTTMKDEDADDF